MSAPLFLCLDQGGGSSRAFVVDARGGVVGAARREVATRHPQPDRVEQVPAVIVQSLRDAAAQVVAQLDAAQRRRLRAAALVTQRASCLCWNRASGEPLTPILSWQDRRAAAALEAGNLDKKAVQRLTGLVPTAYLGASKLQWCLQHERRVQRAAADGELAMGPLASWLRRQLVGAQSDCVDIANAGRTLLCDLAKGQWSDTLLRQFGLPAALPAIVPSDADFGECELGPWRGSLRLLNGDQSSALFAYGAPRADTAYINMGTGAFVYVPLAAPMTDTPLQCSLCWWSETGGRGQRQYVLEGTVHGAGAALDDWSRRTGVDYRPRLDAVLARHTEPPLFINSVGGLGSPDWCPTLAPHWLDDSRADSDAGMAAVAESLVFLLQRNLDAIARCGIALRRIVISGGLSLSDALCQRVATLSAMPVYRYAEQEASVLGAAYCLAGFPDNWQATAQLTRFEPGEDRALARRYRRWSDALDGALRGQ